MPKSSMNFAAAALLLGLCTFVAGTQVMPMLPDTGPTKVDPSIKVPEFDVASVKPHKGKDNMMRIETKPDGFATTNLPLASLIMYAYGIRQDLITGGAAWVQSTRFDLEAKVAEADVATLKKLSPQQRRSMMKGLLAERFKLQLHTETRNLPVYDLVIAKGGPKLTTAAPEPPPDPDAKPGDPPKGGAMMRMSPGEFEGQDLPMTSIAGEFADVLERSVIDKTGLTGKYDVKLKWTPEDGPAQAVTDSGAESTPSIFTAVQEQLGLKLVSSKGPVETLVIDHAELPTEN